MALGLLLIPWMGSGAASAIPLGFDCITNNVAADCAIGEAQLTVDVTDPGPGGVMFTFHNAGPAASSITDVYFDDADFGALHRISVIIDTPPFVDFEQFATPGDLPGANNASPPFQVTRGFSADSESPAQPKGVNPDESLMIVFLLKDGKTFDDVLASLEDGSLRVGIHVQDYATGGSESLVNTPEPGVLGLVGLGLLVLAARSLR